MEKLPENTVKLIKSGQVVSSIWSVIKELVENSIDAGATNVEVRLINFGLDCIEVKDNGLGVAANEIPQMVEAHCTSKIKNFDDLESVQSYGFRGEALHSLCSVSTLEITSKRVQDKTAKYIKFDSKLNRLKENFVAMTNGTIIRATNLFENMPVRKHYIKNSNKQKVEDLKKTEKVLWSYGLIHPALRVSLNHNKESQFLKTSCDSILKACRECFGVEISSHLRRIEYEQDHFQVEIVIGKPGETMEKCLRSTNDQTFTFVNKRPVTIKGLDKVLRKIFHGNYPIGVINIKTSQDELDVNVEPNKTSVMIGKQQILLDFIESKLEEDYGSSVENIDPDVEKRIVSNNSKDQNQINTKKVTKNDAPKENVSNNIIMEKSSNDDDEEIVDVEQSGDCIIINEKGSWAEGNLFKSKTTGLPIQPTNIIVNKNKNINNDLEKSRDFTPPVSKNFSSSSSLDMYTPSMGDDARPRQVLITSFSSLNDSMNPEDISRNKNNKRKLEFAPMEETTPKSQKMQKKIKRFNDDESFEEISSFMDIMRAKQDKLDKSISSTESDQTFACQICGKPYIESVSLENHIKSVHENTQPLHEKEILPSTNNKIKNPKSAEFAGEKNEKQSKMCHKKAKNITFDMKKLYQQTNEEEKERNRHQIRLIGQINDCWIVKNGQEGNFILNQFRLQEVRLFRKLMQNFVFSTTKLATGNVDLKEHFSWNDEFNKTLDKLMENNEVIDPRILDNGLKVIKQNGKPILSETSPDVKFLGISDLQEILKIIESNPNATLEETRPLKIRAYLKSKTSAMIKQLPPNPDEDNLETFIESLNFSEENNVCIHAKPLFHQFMD